MTKYKLNTLERQQSHITITKAKSLPHGQFEAVLSTDDLDRHGEHVSIKGLDIPKNQVIKMYYNHETNGANLPIGKWLKVYKKDNVLMGLGEIDLEDEFALKVYKKVLKGIIDSISIGFYPTEYDGETSTWTKSTLVEASVVAEPANVNAVITSKELGFTNEEFKSALKVKLKEAEAPKEEVKTEVKAHEKLAGLLQKGGVADVLNQQDKWEEMEDFWEVVYAFSDAYYKAETPVTDFNSLLTECISILQTIVDGTYQYEDEDETDSSDASGASVMAEIKTATEELKSRIGALEAAGKAANESPAIKQLIKVRIAAKAVDKQAEVVNQVIKIKLKETI